MYRSGDDKNGNIVRKVRLTMQWASMITAVIFIGPSH